MYKQIHWCAKLVALKPNEVSGAGWRSRLGGWLRKAAHKVEGQDVEGSRDVVFLYSTMPVLSEKEIDDCLEAGRTHAESLMKEFTRMKAIDHELNRHYAEAD